MLIISLKLIFRNIWKYKGISAINIFGLSVGMASSILLLLWVNYHLGFDTFHENSGNVYRVIQHIKFEDLTTWTITQGPLGPSLKEEAPEITDYCRLSKSGLSFKKGEEQITENGTYADPSYFHMFSIKVISKLTDIPVSEPNHIAISESMARKYFGEEDPLGQTLSAVPDREFMVTAVFEDYPKQTHWWFDYMIPFEHLGTLGYTIDQWNNSGYYTYVALDRDISREQAVEKIKNFLKPKPTLEEFATLDLQPVREIHFTTGYDFESANTIDVKYLRTFSGIGIFLIIMACINFMNLVTARSSRRMREIGMKKVMGAYQTNLMAQFIGEAILISFISVLIAMMMVELVRPAFNNISRIGLIIDYSDIRIYFYLAGFAIVTGVFAGMYPAFYLSSFKSISALRGSTEKGNSRHRLRMVLVVFQFTISIILITVTIIISRQINYMLNKDLGYNKEDVIYFEMSEGFQDNFESIKDDMLGYPAVRGMTRAAALPTYGYNFSNSRFRWDGQDLSKETLFRALFVGFDYFSTLQAEIKEGRAFDKNFASDSSAIILNEAALRETGIDNPVGMEFRFLLSNGDVRKLNVVGISKDYHFRSLHSEIDPQIIIYNPGFCNWALLRINMDEFSNVTEILKHHWNQYESSSPISINFLDDRVSGLYDQDRVIRKIILFFTFIGMLISILGLIGLTGYTIEQKTREIALRKLLGAKLSHIQLKISSDFLKWILISLLVSVPVSYFFMNNWLEHFAYRIDLQWWLMIIGGFIAIIVAFVCIGIQSNRAVRMNPAESLKYE